MSSLHKRLARIKAVVKIDELLYDYGYHIHLGGGDREQQFSCDMHGTGRDNKPSARVYPATGQFYCWGCDKSRDAVELVRAKERMSTKEALSFLETKYNLPYIAPEYGEDDPPQNAVEVLLDAKRTWEDDMKQLVLGVKSATQDKQLPMDTVLAYWEAIDKVSYQVHNKIMTESIAQASVQKLYAKLLQTMRDGYTDQ